MRKLFFIFLICSCALSAFAQRYSHEVFNKVDHKTVTYAAGLEMDIYQPVGDTISERPVMLYVHGGGFSGGKRDEPKIIAFCEDMAKRGMVAVSMSYTLTMKGKSFGCDQSAENKMATFKQSGSEIGKAAAYLLKNQKALRIDPSAVVLTGSSAGAEAILHAAYWPETKKDLPKDFQYGGVISMAGALYDIDLINSASVLPTMLFHGTCDNLVPYGKAPHHYCSESDSGYLMLYGSYAIMEHLKFLNEGYYLVTGCNDGHEWNSTPMGKYNDEIAEFVKLDVLEKEKRQVHTVIKTDKSCELGEWEFCIKN